jgi:hypothetical protein
MCASAGTVLLATAALPAQFHFGGKVLWARTAYMDMSSELSG